MQTTATGNVTKWGNLPSLAWQNASGATCYSNAARPAQAIEMGKSTASYVSAIMAARSALAGGITAQDAFNMAFRQGSESDAIRSTVVSILEEEQRMRETMKTLQADSDEPTVEMRFDNIDPMVDFRYQPWDGT